MRKISKGAPEVKGFYSFGLYALLNILLVVIPILIILPMFFASMHAQVLNEVIEMRTQVMSRERDNIEGALENFGSMVLYASLDPELRPYQLRQGNYDTITALRHLKLHESSLNDMQVYFYIHSDDRFYSSSGSLTIATFRKLFRLDGDWTDEQFMNLIDNPYPYATSPAGCSLTSDDLHSKRFIAVYYPWKNGGVLYGTAMGLISAEWFADQLALDSITNTYVLDADGSIMFGENDARDRALVEASLTGQETDIRVEGEKYYLIRQESEVNGWRYLAFIPASHIAQILLGEHLPLLLVIMGLTIGLSVVGVLLAMRYYLPLLGLSKMLDHTGADMSGDVRHLYDRVRHVVVEREDIKNELEETREYIRQNLITQLIRGGMSHEECVAALKKAGTALTGTHFGILAIDLGRVPLNERNSAFARLLDCELLIADALYKEYLVALYDGDGGDRFADEYARRIGEALGEIPGVRPRIGVGQLSESLHHMDRSYVEAVAALENGPDQPVIYFDSLAVSGAIQSGQRPYQERVRLAETIRQGSSPAVHQALAELERALFELNGRVDKLDLLFALNGVVHGLLSTLEEAGIENLGWEVSRLTHTDAVGEFMKRLRPLCESAAAAYAQKRESWMDLKIKDILTYVDQHYKEQNISLSGIAARFEMTNTSLSRLFGECIGMRFIDYLSKLRMSYAAELLSDTSLSIGEIVELVGYIDGSSFTRKFTKLYSVSPSAYRKQHKRNEAVKS